MAQISLDNGNEEAQSYIDMIESGEKSQKEKDNKSDEDSIIEEQAVLEVLVEEEDAKEIRLQAVNALLGLSTYTGHIFRISSRSCLVKTVQEKA
jgi:hypothetical protein